MVRFTPEQTLESTRHNLDLAGNPNNWTPSEFFGVRAVACAALGGLIFLVLSIANVDWLPRIGMTVVFALLGFMLPALWLGQKIRSRKDSVIRSLPDALDLLTICVEATWVSISPCSGWPRNGITISAAPLRGCCTKFAWARRAAKRCATWPAAWMSAT
jgi:hypothetical protein